MDVVVDLSSYKTTSTCMDAMHIDSTYFGWIMDSSTENKESNTKTMEPVHYLDFRNTFFNPNVKDSILD